MSSDLLDLCEFGSNLNKLLEKSNFITNSTVDSICTLEVKIMESHSRLEEIFTKIDVQELSIRNIEKCVLELDSFVKLFETIDKDSLRIVDGPKGAFNDYIEKLLYIKTIEKYHYIKEFNANFFKTSFIKYNSLLAQGEKMLVQEFQDVIKHYSNTATISFLIKHLTDKFETTETESSPILFIPIETVSKLEQICWWFLQQEQQYELYNDQNEHCDINQKLKYSEIRNEFLKSVINTYSTALSERYKTETDEPNHSNDEKPVTSFFQKLFKQDILTTSAAGCIELFARNLDFYLKLLKHENILVSNIYYRSTETRVELISKLTILVIDSIEDEFEQFFINAYDFSKLANICDAVVTGIISLILKVQNLKEKASCLQTEDLSSASKMLQFSMHLNEMSGQIFTAYLEVVKTGYFNHYVVPTHCTVHEYCIKTLDICRLINKHEKGLMDSIKKACGSVKTSTSKSDDSCEPSQEYRNARNQRGRKVPKSEENDDFSSRTFVGKYFSLLIERLCHFLIEESLKFSSDENQLILSERIRYALRYNKMVEFREQLKSLKVFVFLVNNLEYIRKFLTDLNMTEIFRRINPDFETNLDKIISMNIDKACDVFRFLVNKWENIEEIDSNQNINKKLIYKQGSHDLHHNIRKSPISIFSAPILVQAQEEPVRESDPDKGFLIGISKMSQSLNPFNQSKKKKKEDLLIMLRETFSLSSWIKVEEKSSNESLRNLVSEILRPMLDELNENDDLRDILTDLNICGFREMNVRCIFEKIF